MNEKKHDKLFIDFDLSLIEHLGSQLYTTLPPIVSELISNAYDADADKVEVLFNKNDQGNYDLIISDNGLGIANDSSSLDAAITEIVEKYLTVGRKKRVKENSDVSPVKKRKLQGKKGIGKLAGFGISNKIKVETTSNFKKNSFILDYNKMIDSSKDEKTKKYYPEHVEKNTENTIKQGTKITLYNIKRKSEINLKSLATNISKRLKIFSDDFECILYLNDVSIKIENSLFFDYIKNTKGTQFLWTIPKDLEKLDIDKSIKEFIKTNKVTGEICTSQTPLPKEYQGVVLYARNKMAQDGYMFNDRANDNFYSYLYGHLYVDYIDQDRFVDNISTARGSLVWEKDISIILKENINTIISKIQSEWRAKRKEDKEKIIKKKSNIEYDDWINNLNPIERGTAKKLIDILVEDEDVSTETTIQYIDYIHDFFEFDTFKGFVTEIIERKDISVKDAIEIVQTWGFIESKEMAKISEGRVKAIDTFDKLIKEDASETKKIQPFLEEFPWILDPTVEQFNREVTFSTILKEEFPDNDLDESDRRLDFIIHNINKEIIIYELKRPSAKIKQEYLDQCTDYLTFMRENHPNETVKCILVVGKNQCSGKNARVQKRVEENLEAKIKKGDFNIKTYSELLFTSREYNKEIIKKYKIFHGKNKQH